MTLCAGSAAAVVGCAQGDAIDVSGGTASNNVGATGGAGGDLTGGAGASLTTSTGASGATGPGGTGGDGGSGATGGMGPTCGDNVLDLDEDCDGIQLNGASCDSVVGAGSVGTLACNGVCEFDVSGCSAPPNCGNATIDAGEDCDGANLNGQTCVGLLGAGSTGTLACSPGCLFNASGCTPPPSCGDGTKNAQEACDGGDLGGATCASALGNPSASGPISCNANCTLNTNACIACGDGVVNGVEQCDGLALGGGTCGSATGNPSSTGFLGCNGNCTFNTAGCAVCGDGILQSGEQCDDGNGTNGDGCNACQVVCLSGELQFGLSCYVESGTTASWTAANTNCTASLGGHLVSLADINEDYFVWWNVMKSGSSGSWIGANDQAVEGSWAWTTGQPFSFSLWASGEPNNSSGNEDCAEMIYQNQEWNDDNCGDAKRFICEYDPPVLFP